MKKIIILSIAVLFTGSAVFSQDKAGGKDTTKHTVLYSCPMHPDVVMYKAGTCPKCGMNLEVSKKETMKRPITRNYTCPVHTEIVSAKSGKCPKCGTKMNRSPKEKMKAEVTKQYICPMHADAKSDKPGKCPKCGMDLEEVK